MSSTIKTVYTSDTSRKEGHLLEHGTLKHQDLEMGLFFFLPKKYLLWCMVLMLWCMNILNEFIRNLQYFVFFIGKKTVIYYKRSMFIIQQLAACQFAIIKHFLVYSYKNIIKFLHRA